MKVGEIWASCHSHPVLLHLRFSLLPERHCMITSKYEHNEQPIWNGWLVLNCHILDWHYQRLKDQAALTQQPRGKKWNGLRFEKLKEHVIIMKLLKTEGSLPPQQHTSLSSGFLTITDPVVLSTSKYSILGSVSEKVRGSLSKSDATMVNA